ncbi:hypothetical protein DVH24_035863 [Malus domestica]|uniref:Uncharacterized protein n=1 Tax=Malus domestica TaxID=3750 RepID=A0A498JPX6_MALDO|nr:hypothetical protein DVH24_035863 [Malus domestica]
MSRHPKTGDWSEISNFTSCSSPRNSLSDNGCSLGFSFSKFFEKIFIEYIMLDGMNDEKQHAHQLGKLLETFQVGFLSFQINLLLTGYNQRLRFIGKKIKLEIQLSRLEQVLSAFALDKEPYMHTLEGETTPFGLLARGIYVAKLKVRGS